MAPDNTPPNPLPKTLPAGTRLRNGPWGDGWHFTGPATLSEDGKLYAGKHWDGRTDSHSDNVCSPEHIDWSSVPTVCAACGDAGGVVNKHDGKKWNDKHLLCVACWHSPIGTNRHGEPIADAIEKRGGKHAEVLPKAIEKPAPCAACGGPSNMTAVNELSAVWPEDILEENFCADCLLRLGIDDLIDAIRLRRATTGAMPRRVVALQQQYESFLAERPATEQ